MSGTYLDLYFVWAKFNKTNLYLLKQQSLVYIPWKVGGFKKNLNFVYLAFIMVLVNQMKKRSAHGVFWMLIKAIYLYSYSYCIKIAVIVTSLSHHNYCNHDSGKSMSKVTCSRLHFCTWDNPAKDFRWNITDRFFGSIE